MPTKVNAKHERGSIDPQKLYTKEQIAEWMGVTPVHVRNMMRDGRIGYVLVGEHRGRRIRGAHDLDYIERNNVDPAAA